MRWPPRPDYGFLDRLGLRARTAKVRPVPIGSRIKTKVTSRRGWFPTGRIGSVDQSETRQGVISGGSHRSRTQENQRSEAQLTGDHENARSCLLIEDRPIIGLSVLPPQSSCCGTSAVISIPDSLAGMSVFVAKCEPVCLVPTARVSVADRAESGGSHQILDRLGAGTVLALDSLGCMTAPRSEPVARAVPNPLDPVQS